MAGTTNRTVIIRQSSSELDALRLLYQLRNLTQPEYFTGAPMGLNPADGFLMPRQERGKTVVGWSLDGWNMNTPSSPRSWGFDQGWQGITHEQNSKVIKWNTSISGTTNNDNLRQPVESSLDFYDRLGGHDLYWWLPTQDNPVHFAQKLRRMVRDALPERTDDQREALALLRFNNAEDREILTQMLSYAPRAWANDEDYDLDGVPLLNRFVYEQIVRLRPMNPNADAMEIHIREPERRELMLRYFFPRARDPNYNPPLAQLLSDDISWSDLDSVEGRRAMSRTTDNGGNGGEDEQQQQQQGDEEQPQDQNRNRGGGGNDPASPGLYSAGLIVQRVIDAYYGRVSLEARLAAFAALGGDSTDFRARAYEYFDFQAECPFYEDYASSVAKDFLNPGNPNVLSFARAVPEYNYYSQQYEEAISNEAIPESLLPNMYIYHYSTQDNPEDLAMTQTSAFEAAWKERVPDGQRFDSLITLGEFNKDLLPYIGSENFANEYISNIYPGAVQNVSIDLTSQLAAEYYNMISPANEMDVYQKLNSLKNKFPMYVEFSIPTIPAGEITGLLGSALTSANFISALSEASRLRPMQARVQTNSYILNNLYGVPREGETRGGARDRAILDAYKEGLDREALAGQLTEGTVPMAIPNNDNWDEPAGELPSVNQWDFEEWFREATTAITQTYSPAQRLQFQATQNRIREKIIEHAPSYEDALNGALCRSETIAYRLSKMDVNRNNEVVQNFYFANTNNINIIDFVDTQVKYNKHYKYELHGYAIVYGSKFEFKATEYREEATPITLLQHEGDNQNDRPRRVPLLALPSAKFEIQSTPQAKIIEYSIFSEDWMGETALMAAEGSPSPSPHGLVIPFLKVLDEPPVPPEIEVVPYRGNHENILINCQVGTGASHDHGGLAPYSFIMMSESDRTDFENLAVYQKSLKHFGLESPQLMFETEDQREVQRIEIYRTTTLPATTRGTTTTDLFPQSIYYRFGGVPHKILDISNSPEVPEDESATSFDFIDNIEVNQKYYYTARSIDRHGHKSNPTPIFVVEIVYEDGLSYPVVENYRPASVPITNRTKPMNKFVEIKAAQIQTYVHNSRNQDGSISSTQGLIDEGGSSIYTDDFIIRIVSKDTGKRFDLKFGFKKEVDVDDVDLDPDNA